MLALRGGRCVPTLSWVTEEELERLDELQGPLFDLWLKFREDFARTAIESLDISDEDAEKCARMMEAGGTDAGRSFAYLMRHIADERRARKVLHMAAAVMEHEGVRSLRYEGIRERYERIPKGDA